MTLSEFKAWFEGYTEGLEAAPTKAQFERIKEKVSEITGTPITQTVFIDRYRDIWPKMPGWQQPYVSYSAGAASMGQGVGNAVMPNIGAAPESARYSAGPSQTVEWDSYSAMHALGKADALAA